jgi:glutamyl-tRNA reductase
MNIVVLGMSHKTVPVEIREDYSFKEEDLPAALKTLKNIEGVLECAILSTCNRVELYALMLTEDVGGLRDFLLKRNNLKEPSSDQIQRYIYIYQNENALEHLCRVSSGLDSMVLGEPQIFGQMKDAYELAVDTGTVGSVFRSLFPQIFSLVKKVRSVTDIGRNNVSVSYVAVNLARKIFNDIQGRSVMILGAGEMGELTVRNLMSNGVKKVYVSNRTFEKAVKLAETFNGIPIMFYELFEYLPKTDIVISSINAQGYVINREQVAETCALRNGKPLILIDISVPRSINPNVAGLEKVYLYNIDDLKSVAESGLLIRTEEAEKANQIIRDRAQTILNKLNTYDMVPAIISLRTIAEEIRLQEYDKLMSALNVPDDQKSLIESHGKSMVSQIVYHTIVKMREYVNTMKFK